MDANLSISSSSSSKRPPQSNLEESSTKRHHESESSDKSEMRRPHREPTAAERELRWQKSQMVLKLVGEPSISNKAKTMALPLSPLSEGAFCYSETDVQAAKEANRAKRKVEGDKYGYMQARHVPPVETSVLKEIFSKCVIEHGPQFPNKLRGTPCDYRRKVGRMEKRVSIEKRMFQYFCRKSVWHSYDKLRLCRVHIGLHGTTVDYKVLHALRLKDKRKYYESCHSHGRFVWRHTDDGGECYMKSKESVIRTKCDCYDTEDQSDSKKGHVHIATVDRSTQFENLNYCDMDYLNKHDQYPTLCASKKTQNEDGQKSGKKRKTTDSGNDTQKTDKPRRNMVDCSTQSELDSKHTTVIYNKEGRCVIIDNKKFKRIHLKAGRFVRTDSESDSESDSSEPEHTSRRRPEIQQESQSSRERVPRSQSTWTYNPRLRKRN